MHLASSVEKVASHPQMIADCDCVRWANLEFPLTWHYFCVGTRDGQTGVDAPGGVLLNNFSSTNFFGAYTTIVRALRSRETTIREPCGPAGRGVEHRVLLL